MTHRFFLQPCRPELLAQLCCWSALRNPWVGWQVARPRPHTVTRHKWPNGLPFERASLREIATWYGVLGYSRKGRHFIANTICIGFCDLRFSLPANLGTYSDHNFVDGPPSLYRIATLGITTSKFGNPHNLTTTFNLSSSTPVMEAGRKTQSWLYFLPSNFFQWGCTTVHLKF